MENINETQESIVDTFGAELVDKWKSEGKLYRRKIEPIVDAEKVTEAKVVETKLPDGTVESSQKAKAGDWIITGSKGEKFVFTQAKVDSLYTVGEDGKFMPRERKILALKNPSGKPIKINAPWGTPEKPDYQSGTEDCMLVVSLDDNGEMTNDRYIIGNEEMLLNNYEPISE